MDPIQLAWIGERDMQLAKSDSPIQASSMHSPHVSLLAIDFAAEKVCQIVSTRYSVLSTRYSVLGESTIKKPRDIACYFLWVMIRGKLDGVQREGKRQPALALHLSHHPHKADGVVRSTIRERIGMRIPLTIVLVIALNFLWSHAGVFADGLTTWDGKHSIQSVEVTVVYFVPKDRIALPDWQDRVRYFTRRIEQFHAREFQGQSTLRTKTHAEPFRSAKTTEQLRAGDADFIFFATIREVETAVPYLPAERSAFPVLLVLSDINWRPLEDFYRLRPINGTLQFEGQFNQGRHFPGAQSGGARATYLADRGVGWGLVSADGWRVPYSGTDCVVYHEGVGHPIGLPHPQPGNGSVMSLAQYNGWISESWLDDPQKAKLGWKSNEPVVRSDLFSTFQALPEPLVPKPDEEVALEFKWPTEARVKKMRVRWQTELFGPWSELPSISLSEGMPPTRIAIGRFDRQSPVSYRVDAELVDGQSAELWGYFQVRAERDRPVLPLISTAEGPVTVDHPDANIPPMNVPPRRNDEIDLLALTDVTKHAVSGQWVRADERLESPKQYGARIELPYQPPEEYELTVVAEPLDEPNGLILGQRSGNRRFLVLVGFAQAEGDPASALENIDGLNVNRNATTLRANLLKQNRPFQVICTVRKQSVVVRCDGQEIIHWKGDPERLSLSDYWKTPRDEVMFIGAYDCRYRFHRISLAPISGTGKTLP
jgi:hypothetical protein